ncbi:MAG TPA: Tol-Pal system beta propeller repeat protein TolB [Thermoanaerobaculia bacterium]|nr:Tol-Pal system beta propeller repeat protein TolB [Thermoanaerobaculia bacterium]
MPRLHRSEPHVRHWSLAGLGLLLVFAVGLAAQQPTPAPAPETPPAGTPPDQVTLVLQPGDRPLLRLAFPALAPLAAPAPAEAQAAARELEEALRADLLAAGIFSLQGPAELAPLELTGDLRHDFEQYRSLGNEVVLLGELKLEGDRLALEGRIFDLPSGQAILGKRYRGTFDIARRIAHTFADEIVLHFTGRRGVALTSIAFYSDRDGEKEIYLMDYDGRNQRRITAHRSISMSPAWSPTGDAVAYVSFFAGSGPAIYLADIASGLKRPVVTSGSLNTSPSFSPDGRRLTFARSLGSNIEIFVCERDGSGLRQLTYSSGIDTNPAWSPSGREIAFTSSRGTGRPQIYVMDAEGSNLRRITFAGEYNDGAAWSPDGTRIAYSARQANGQFAIAVSDLVTLDSRLLVVGNGSHESPSFSPDGRRIAFTSTRGGRSQIHVVGAEGGESRALTSQGNNYAPDWSGYPQ